MAAQERAQKALTRALVAAFPAARLDRESRVSRLEQNLVGFLTVGQLRTATAQIERGAVHELVEEIGRFRAHSAPIEDQRRRSRSEYRLRELLAQRFMEHLEHRVLASGELSLLVPTHPLELRRERGELLVRLGAHLDGAVELETYAALVDDVDETTAEACRREARQARARLN